MDNDIFSGHTHTHMVDQCEVCVRIILWVMICFLEGEREGVKYR